VSVLEGLPSGEAYESKEVTSNKRNVTKKPSIKSFLFENSAKFNFFEEILCAKFRIISFC
jgi:hypothetical protein